MSKCVEAAATDTEGFIFLRVNPEHPGDHRISDSGQKVAAIRVDDLLTREGSPAVGLIKIDTQGNEMRVLMGATETLARCRPSLFVEIDDEALRQNGSTASEVIRFLAGQGYGFQILDPSGNEKWISASQAVAEAASAKRGYFDLLCVHQIEA